MSEIDDIVAKLEARDDTHVVDSTDRLSVAIDWDVSTTTIRELVDIVGVEGRLLGADTRNFLQWDVEMLQDE